MGKIIRHQCECWVWALEGLPREAGIVLCLDLLPGHPWPRQRLGRSPRHPARRRTGYGLSSPDAIDPTLEALKRVVDRSIVVGIEQDSIESLGLARRVR